MNLEFNVNFLGFVAILVICGCLVKIVENIMQTIVVDRAFRKLANFTDEQRDKVLKMVEKEQKKKK